MQKSLTLKTLLRSPLKTILTFLLIAASSFALFSRVTDYAVTIRETAKAKGFYHGVAALDNTVPDMEMEWFDSSGFRQSIVQEVEDKPWPTKEQLAEFTSLPGVTLEDTRYMTAGLMDQYKRVFEESYDAHGVAFFLLEGTYEGYTEDGLAATLMFGDVKLIAESKDFPLGKSAAINYFIEDELIDGGKNPYSREFWERMKGKRLLVMGNYSSGSVNEEGKMLAFYDETMLEPFRIIDGLGKDFLETEGFSDYKKLKEALDRDIYAYDIVYTSDTRAIPSFNDRKMVVTQGRPLAEGDTDGCVVSELFLNAYDLSVGDTVSVRLGDMLCTQNPLYGTTSRGRPALASGFSDDAVDLKIVGAYRMNDTLEMRISEWDWSYSPSTVFVPKSLLSIKIPDDYETSVGEYSVLIEDARNIESFKEAAEPLAARMGVSLRFSDGGWMNVEKSFGTGALTSFLTAALYVVGAALALLLASYLYVGRNKESYAIMRAMGVPRKKAGGSLVLPFAALSAAAMPIGGAVGLFYTSKAAAGALASLAGGAVEGYVPDAALPAGAIAACLLVELAFATLATLFFLHKMKKMPPLELLQGGTLRAGMGKKAAPDMAGSMAAPARVDVAGIPAAGGAANGKGYSTPRHATSFVLRHIRRSVGKTAVSLALTAALTTGLGVFTLARLTYRDAFHKVEVKVTAMDFSSSAAMELSAKLSMAKGFYGCSTFSVRTNGMDLKTPMVFTNDLNRYMEGGHTSYTVDYADGYDASALNSDSPVCLIGERLAERLGINAGNEVALLSDVKYAALKTAYEDERELQKYVDRETIMYQVIGTVSSADSTANERVYAGINWTMEELYGQKFSFGYCEFILADNGKVDEADRVLANLKNSNSKYANKASYYIDSEALKDVTRIRTLLEALFSIAVAAAVLIGMAGYLLIILQSAKKAALLRILGVTKKYARCMLVLEQILLCVAGIILVAGSLMLYSPELFARGAQTLAICYALYFLGCLCGAAAAAVHVTRGRVLELLQVQE